MDDSSRRGPGAFVVIGFLLGFSVAAFMATRDSELTFLEIGAWIGPELVGIGITILVIDEWNKRRARRELEARLLRQIRSSVRDVAVAALDELTDLEYLGPDKDTLAGIDLEKIQWAGADLIGTNLQGTNLLDANLQGADLSDTNLQDADLWGANLQGADLWETNLQGADLRGANLQGADLWETIFDETTTIPDGSQWAPGTDMTRFTNPDHPDFWRSNDPNSPAYRGRSDQTDG